ncbi:putative AdpA-family transcriptional regulator [Actinoplanes missouriensis 431]|uniref:Putative AdpA-family transcriptional regulator n=1 Tax=Actinoplanes missouriensis (strain ATCC 14538 / DSM 43046 / CBS 188.64 / JCM 3121 / NBRC 102363 / NCIMB 12654 / NRRL B-3342 / UNCC 431) TaxID=512565 RepID=I0H6D7_ACTM4|nr:helix-turn-helix domain-containing protein [Actinoplanes missouriensis]BAL88574.1 putative AdpA-family transcriptional regulator [Actinoplanes missouriensis 431]
MRIAIHAFAGMSMFHLATPLLVFTEAAEHAPAPDWHTVVWSTGGEPVTTADGVALSLLAGAEAVDDADILVIPSWPNHLPAPDPEFTALIRAAHARGTVVVGLCLGAYPVAASGILHGRTAATHWAATQRLADDHPSVTVDPSALYIDHGDVLTSAGTASGLDACLHLVRRRLGAAAAATVARHMVIAPHREGDQAQYIETPVPAADDTDPVGRATSWALANLGRPLHVEQLAEQARMSPRNFSRHFRRVTGTTPAHWLLSRRLDRARTLLETTSLPVEQVATESGFASVVTFRQRFAAAYATTPSSYRRRFA